MKTSPDARLLLLNAAEVETLLPVSACIPLMEQALADRARGRFHQPLRFVVPAPGAPGLLAMMPAWAGASGEGAAASTAAYALKAIAVFPGNAARGLDAHQGAVLLYSGETGVLQAVINASAVTAIRTAAVTAAATRALARSNAGDLALIGAGVQAGWHLKAMAAVRPLRRVRVASRSAGSAQTLADRMAPDFDFPIEAAPGVEAAVRGADLIVVVTSSATPVLEGGWLAKGVHLNLVGACRPDQREADGAAMASGRLWVDSRESAEKESGDYRIAVAEGAIGPDHIAAEIGEVLAGMKPGRASAEEITVFKSLGLAVEDLASAQYLYNEARRRGEGTWVPFQ